MKRSVKFLGLIALIAIFGFALVSCEMEEAGPVVYRNSAFVGAWVSFDTSGGGTWNSGGINVGNQPDNGLVFYAGVTPNTYFSVFFNTFNLNGDGTWDFGTGATAEAYSVTGDAITIGSETGAFKFNANGSLTISGTTTYNGTWYKQ